MPDGGVPPEADAEPASPAATPASTGGGSRNAWLWSIAMVLLALITAGIVFLLATRDQTATPGAAPSPSVTVASTEPAVTPTPSVAPSATSTPAPTPAPTAAPTPTPAPPANTPTQQARLLFPNGGTACGSTANYSPCPVTPTLVDAANQWRINHNPSSPEPLCRCPAPYLNPSFIQDDSQIPVGLQGNPHYAAVRVRLFFDATHYEDVVVLFTRQPDGVWLAYDTYCDDPHNSLGAGGATTCTVHP